jgi:hypothetical protein
MCKAALGTTTEGLPEALEQALQDLPHACALRRCAALQRQPLSESTWKCDGMLVADRLC